MFFPWTVILVICLKPRGTQLILCIVEQNKKELQLLDYTGYFKVLFVVDTTLFNYVRVYVSLIGLFLAVAGRAN